MKNLEIETRLDVIHRSVQSVRQPVDPQTLAHLIETNLREWELYHASKRWQEKL